MARGPVGGPTYSFPVPAATRYRANLGYLAAMRHVLATALSLVATVAAAAPPEAPTMESGNYADLCRDRNTKRGVLDEDAYAYCFKDQTEGNRKVAKLLEENAGYPWIQGVLDAAVEQCTKRGTRNDSVLAFAINKQVEAYKDFEYAAKKPDYVSRVGDVCKEKWTRRGAPNWDMIMFCYRRATEVD